MKAEFQEICSPIELFITDALSVSRSWVAYRYDPVSLSLSTFKTQYIGTFNFCRIQLFQLTISDLKPSIFRDKTKRLYGRKQECSTEPIRKISALQAT